MHLFSHVVPIPRIIPLNSVIVFILFSEASVFLVEVINYLLVVMVNIPLLQSHHPELHFDLFVAKAMCSILALFLNENMTTIQDTESWSLGFIPFLANIAFDHIFFLCALLIVLLIALGLFFSEGIVLHCILCFQDFSVVT